MSQMVLDVRYGTSAVEHINCLAVAKRMNRIDVLQPFGRQSFFEILFADAVDAMAGKLLPPLVDKDPVLVLGLWGDAVFSDIELEELTGLGFNLCYPEPVSLSQDRKGLFFGVKVVQVQRRHFGGPGGGVIEQMKESIIPEPLFRPQVNGVENFQDLILVKESDERFLRPFLGDVENGICDLTLFRILEPDHFGKGLEGREPLVAGLDQVFSLLLEVFKECND